MWLGQKLTIWTLWSIYLCAILMKTLKEKNMRQCSITFIFLSVLCFSIAVAAQEKTFLAETHSSAGIECVDCHETAEPVKKASAKKCKECHGDMTDADEINFKDSGGGSHTLNPHNAHPGEIRCTLCHASHKASTLYCNTCHKFELQVP